MDQLGRWLHKAAYPLLRVYFSFHKQPRTRVWLTNQHGQILLVKTWFGSQRWSLPGGGMERGETPTQAVRRELREETGINLPESAFTQCTQLRPRGTAYEVAVFQAQVANDELPPLERGRNLEIIGRMWVDPRQLPSDTSNLVVDLSKSLMLADKA